MAVTLDTTKKYFFHNIYGDAQTLLDTLPSDVVAVPAGWSPEAESNREEYTTALGQSPNAYPTVFYYRDEFDMTITTTDVEDHPNASAIITEDGNEVFKYATTMAAGWYQCRIYKIFEKPWSWTQINTEIQRRIDNNIVS